jgi:glycosyltransferase involved in cell wall biosynthesis
MPRRGRDEARQVLGILGARGALRGWRVSEIDGLSERAVGDALRESAVFLSLAYHEGFGLPAAEAMACGAYVVGFDGFGGHEFFKPEFCSPVESGDVLSFARTLEEVLERQAGEPGWCERRGAAAARFIAAEYSAARERREVLRAYATFAGRPERCCGC